MADGFQLQGDFAGVNGYVGVSRSSEGEYSGVAGVGAGVFTADGSISQSGPAGDIGVEPISLSAGLGLYGSYKLDGVIDNGGIFHGVQTFGIGLGVGADVEKVGATVCSCYVYSQEATINLNTFPSASPTTGPSWEPSGVTFDPNLSDAQQIAAQQLPSIEAANPVGTDALISQDILQGIPSSLSDEPAYQNGWTPAATSTSLGDASGAPANTPATMNGIGDQQTQDGVGSATPNTGSGGNPGGDTTPDTGNNPGNDNAAGWGDGSTSSASNSSPSEGSGGNPGGDTSPDTGNNPGNDNAQGWGGNDSDSNTSVGSAPDNTPAGSNPSNLGGLSYDGSTGYDQGASGLGNSGWGNSGWGNSGSGNSSSGNSGSGGSGGGSGNGPQPVVLDLKGTGINITKLSAYSGTLGHLFRHIRPPVTCCREA